MSRRRVGILAAAGGGAALGLTTLAIAFGGQAERGSSASGFGASGLYVDATSDAAEQERRWTADGRTADARAIQAISRRPGATWFGEPDRDPEPVAARVGRLTTRAAAADQVPVVVVYSIPFRDCGSFSSGGSSTAAGYLRYVRDVAEGIGARPAIVVLEPDATPHIADQCVSGTRARERERLLRSATGILKQRPRTRVYLDAGNAGFIAPDRIAPILRRAGIADADGFAVNVANFRTTDESLRHGREISRRIGDKPFVVDTGRNGNGPWRSADPESWCNPPGRALGTPPKLRPGPSRVDAYLWIKHPGASDGTCRSGPPAGRWWPEYALELARNTG